MGETRSFNCVYIHEVDDRITVMGRLQALRYPTGNLGYLERMGQTVMENDSRFSIRNLCYPYEPSELEGVENAVAVAFKLVPGIRLGFLGQPSSIPLALRCGGHSALADVNVTQLVVELS
jgi:hypothetical protein